MIAEEYLFSDLEEYLYENNNLLIVGEERQEERSRFFINLWLKKKKNVLQIVPQFNDSRMVEIHYYENGQVTLKMIVDVCIDLPRILRKIQIGFKNVLVDCNCSAPR